MEPSSKKMIMAVIPRDDARLVLDMLVTAGYPVTFLESRGGVLRQAQYALYTCVDADLLEDALRIIREYCRTQVEVETEGDARSMTSGSVMPVTAGAGGTVVFVWDVNRIETY